MDDEFYDADELFVDAEGDNEEFADCEDQYALHRAAFENDLPALVQLLAASTGKHAPLLDPHGNNALHIAAFRGHVDAVEALLQANFTTLQKSGRGWSALDEALSLGHSQAAALIHRAMAAEVKSIMKAKKALLLDTMAELPDYSMQLSWQLDSSVPGVGLLVRRYAPSDTYTIWKRGRCIRVDGALMGVDHAASSLLPQWKRGHFSLVYDASGDTAAIWFMDHKKQSYVDIAADRRRMKAGGLAEAEMRAELAQMAGMQVDRTKVKAADVRFKPVKGWFMGDLSERVQGWNTKVYEASGRLVTVNLTKTPFRCPAEASFEQYLTTHFGQDEQEEKALDPFSPDALHETEDQHADRRHSSGGASSSGRERDASGASGKPKRPRYFKGRCWMASDFPMSLRQLLPLLDVVGQANKHVAKVAKFMSKYGDMQQFPVKVQVPLLFTVYALLAFKKFRPITPQDNIGPDFFEVPEGYRRKDLEDLIKGQMRKHAALEAQLARQQEADDCEDGLQKHQAGAAGAAVGAAGADLLDERLAAELSPEELAAFKAAHEELLRAAELEELEQLQQETLRHEQQDQQHEQQQQQQQEQQQAGRQRGPSGVDSEGAAAADGVQHRLE